MLLPFVSQLVYLPPSLPIMLCHAMLRYEGQLSRLTLTSFSAPNFSISSSLPFPFSQISSLI